VCWGERWDAGVLYTLKSRDGDVKCCDVMVSSSSRRSNRDVVESTGQY